MIGPWSGPLAPPTHSARSLGVGEVVEGVFRKPRIISGWDGQDTLQIEVGGRVVWCKPQLHRLLAKKDVRKGDTIRIVRAPDQKIGHGKRLAVFKVKVIDRAGNANGKAGQARQDSGLVKW